MIPYLKDAFTILKSNSIRKVGANYKNIHPLKHHLSRRLCLCGTSYSNYTETENRFNGVYVKLVSDYTDVASFESDLVRLFKKWKEKSRRSVFLKIPIHQSHLIVTASKYGFKYHHAKDEYAMLSIWLDKTSESKLPNFANHTVGVAGACYNPETNDVLLVQDKGRYAKWWKFPGGFSNRHEDIGDCAVRETFEETGVQTKFRSILSFREQHGTSFGQSDFYIIARLHPLTTEINACPHEIGACEWMNIEKVLKMKDTTPFVKICCKLLLQGIERGFRDVDVPAHEFESWVTPGKMFNLYHRPLDSIKYDFMNYDLDIE